MTNNDEWVLKQRQEYNARMAKEAKLTQNLLSFDEEVYIRAVEALREAQIEEAELFVTVKHDAPDGKPRSDWEARALTLLNTQGKVAKLQSMVEVYRSRLSRDQFNATFTEGK